MPLQFTDTQLNELFEEFPALAGRPRQLQELSGGLTNRNVKVSTPDAVYVARCTDTSSNFLGIDRDEEYYNTTMAEQAGVGAPVIDYRPDLGILLLGYLNGKNAVQRRLSATGSRCAGRRGRSARCIRGHGSATPSTCSPSNRTT